MTTTTTLIACGNRKHHRNTTVQAHHESVEQVRQCFATGGILSVEDAAYMAEIGEYVETMMKATPNELRPTLSEDERAAYEAQYAAEYVATHQGATSGSQEPAQAEIDWEAAEVKGQPQEPAEATFESFPDGIYTVVLDGSDHVTLKVRTQGKDEKFAPGKRVLHFLSGPDNSSDYTAFAFLVGQQVRVWKRFSDNRGLADAARALVRNPRAHLEAGHCYKCHRLLTTPESLARGSGDVCAGKK